MATDDNIKNKKPNTLESIGTSDYTRQYRRDLEILEQRSRIETVEMTRLYERIEQARRKYEEISQKVARVSAGQADPSRDLLRSITSPELYRQIIEAKPSTQDIRHATANVFPQYERGYQSVMQRLESRYEGLHQSRRIDAERLFQQHIISSVQSGGGLRSLMYEPNVQAGAQSIMGVASIQDIMKGAKRSAGTVGRVGGELISAASSISQEGGEEAFLSAGQRYEQARRKQAQLELAEKLKRKEISEDEYLLSSTEKFAARIGSQSLRRSIGERAQQGGYGSVSDIQKTILVKESELASAIDKFKESIGSAGNETSELRSKLLQAKSSLEEYNDALKYASDIRRQKIETGIGVARAAINVASYAAIGADQEQMQLRIQAASMMNQKFSDTYAASQGDMSALRRVSEDQFGRAAAFGSAYAKRALGVSGADIGVNVAQGVLSAVSGGGFGQAVGAGASAINAGVRMAKGITRAEVELGFASQYNQLLDVVNEVPDRAKQAYFDFKTSTGRGLMGAGARNIGDLYSQATSAATVEELSRLGISPDRVGDLFGAGARGIGATFVKDARRAGAMVTRAAEFERAGVMPAQQYLQSVSQAVSTGGSEKTIEDIFASAVARGVDDAKSLKGIVDLTQMMSRDAATRGVAAAPGYEAAISAGLKTFADLPIDESLKQGMTANVLQQTLQRQKQTGFNLENIVTVAELGKYGILPAAAGKIGTTDEIEARKIFETYKDRLKPGEDLPRDVLRAVGEFGQVFADPKTGKVRSFDQIEEILDVIPMIKTPGLAFGAGTREERKEIMKKGTGILSIPKYMAGGYDIGGRGPAIDIMADKRRMEEERRKQSILLSEEKSGEYSDLKRIFEVQAQSQSMLIQQGGGFFQQQAGMVFDPVTGQMKPSSALGEIATQMESAQKNIDAEKAGKEAAGAAEKMTIDTSEFDRSVTNFSKAVQAFSEAIRPLGMNYQAASMGLSIEAYQDVEKLNKMAGLPGVLNVGRTKRS